MGLPRGQWSPTIIVVSSAVLVTAHPSTSAMAFIHKGTHLADNMYQESCLAWNLVARRCWVGRAPTLEQPVQKVQIFPLE